MYPEGLHSDFHVRRTHENVLNLCAHPDRLDHAMELANVMSEHHWELSPGPVAVRHTCIPTSLLLKTGAHPCHTCMLYLATLWRALTGPVMHARAARLAPPWHMFSLVNAQVAARLHCFEVDTSDLSARL